MENDRECAEKERFFELLENGKNPYDYEGFDEEKAATGCRECRAAKEMLRFLWYMMLFDLKHFIVFSLRVSCPQMSRLEIGTTCEQILDVISNVNRPGRSGKYLKKEVSNLISDFRKRYPEISEIMPFSPEEAGIFENRE